MRVLIIDDNAAFRAGLRQMLAVLGYDVSEAGDGEQGLHVFRQVGADLVLCDLFMPGTDGVEAIRAFRQESSVPVVAMSGGAYRGSLNLLDAAVHLGACVALAKPFNLETLRRALQAAQGQPHPGPEG